MELAPSQPADWRPAVETLGDLRVSCGWVLASEAFAATFAKELAGLVPAGHPLRSASMPSADLAVAVLDPIRDPAPYGGTIDFIEARWYQLGSWLGQLGMPGDACGALVRAVARAARNVSGDEWTSASSSGWSALQLWMLDHLTGGYDATPPAVPEPPPVVEEAPRGAHSAPETAAPKPAPHTRVGTAAPKPAPHTRVGTAALAGGAKAESFADQVASIWAGSGTISSTRPDGRPESPADQAAAIWAGSGRISSRHPAPRPEPPHPDDTDAPD